ncbi:hypothetical protein VNO77_03906 [Canavalia gladiata]|uniref:Uncharacterized protein n=1 Tax=Canavalia gladiata TaxID=3824 RepID=A0AAN9N0Q5_CANGL
MTSNKGRKSFYFTNILDQYEVQDLWGVFRRWECVWDIYMPPKINAKVRISLARTEELKHNKDKDNGTTYSKLEDGREHEQAANPIEVPNRGDFLDQEPHWEDYEGSAKTKPFHDNDMSLRGKNGWAQSEYSGDINLEDQYQEMENEDNIDDIVNEEDHKAWSSSISTSGRTKGERAEEVWLFAKTLGLVKGRYTGKEENRDREDINMLVPKWWDIYTYKSLDFNAEDPAIAEDDAFSKSSILASIPEPKISFISSPSPA